MSTRRLVESTVTLVRDYLKANMATTLAAIRTDRNDSAVGTDAPDLNSYYIYPSASPKRSPYIYVIAERMEFNKKDANHINANVRVNVSVVVEDRGRSDLMIKAWRYQAALHQLLDKAFLTSADGKVKLILGVTSAEFSPQFSPQKSGGVESTFKQEVVLVCDIEHYENY